MRSISQLFLITVYIYIPTASIGSVPKLQNEILETRPGIHHILELNILRPNQDNEQAIEFVFDPICTGDGLQLAIDSSKPLSFTVHLDNVTLADDIFSGIPPIPSDFKGMINQLDIRKEEGVLIIGLSRMYEYAVILHGENAILIVFKPKQVSTNDSQQ